MANSIFTIAFNMNRGINIEKCNQMESQMLRSRRIQCSFTMHSPELSYRGKIS